MIPEGLASIRPRIAVTMGDPAGVGPEICLRLLQESTIANACVPVVLGDAAVLRRVAAQIGLPFEAPVLRAEAWRQLNPSISVPTVVDLGLLDEVCVSLVPVLFGEGVPYFSKLRGGHVLLDDPDVVQGRRALHLRYPVRRLP